jgi:hypothetical protein
MLAQAGHCGRESPVAQVDATRGDPFPDAPIRGAAILRHPIKELLQTIHCRQLLSPSHQF